MNIRLRQTCSACPEQYDAYDNDTGGLIGYLRLRHGVFTVDCPDVSGETVLEVEGMVGDGRFTDDERQFYLEAACRAIRAHYYGGYSKGPQMDATEYEDIIAAQDIYEAL